MASSASIVATAMIPTHRLYHTEPMITITWCIELYSDKDHIIVLYIVHVSYVLHYACLLTPQHYVIIQLNLQDASEKNIREIEFHVPYSSYFLFKYNLGQKYYGSQVRPARGSNS